MLNTIFFQGKIKGRGPLSTVEKETISTQRMNHITTQINLQSVHN